MTSYLALTNGRQGQVTFPYDLGAFFPGKPAASQLMGRIAAVRAFDLPAGLVGSVASSGTASTAATSISLLKNGTAFGSVAFAAGATAATFSAASAVAFAIGDTLSIQAPATADATLADISITLTGTR